MSGDGGRSSSSVGTRDRDELVDARRAAATSRAARADRSPGTRRAFRSRSPRARARRARSAFSAAAMLMLTWSSLFADVGIVSTPAGCASVLSSEASAAAVTCAIIRPDCSPPSRVRNAGRPLSAGLTQPIGAPLADRRQRHERGGQRDRRRARPARRESCRRTRFRRVSANTIGLSVALLASTSTRLAHERAARRAPRRAPGRRSACE